jgi:predicted  nucleic acid-binding Zn-ribbon protein
MDDIEKNYKNLDKIENNINDLDKRFDNKISTLYDKFSEIDKKATNTETLLNVANKKIENNHKDIVAKIENNHKDIVAKIEAINSNINEIGTRISTVETKIEIENTQKDRKFRQLIYPLISGIIVGIVVFTMNKIFK